MKIEVILQFPENQEDLKELKKRFASFKATLILKSIENLKVKEDEKQLVLINVIEKLENFLKLSDDK